MIPPPPALRPFDEPIPPAAADRWARAQALRTIAFDSAAELELKNAYSLLRRRASCTKPRKPHSIRAILPWAWLTGA